MIHILVTGGNGQLASCLKDIQNKYSNLKLTYTDYQDLDITNLKLVEEFFNKTPFDYCINCAAYTAVDQAEKNSKEAYSINEIGAKNLAAVCKNHTTTLVHISTDFVFDGKKREPYTELDTPNPLSVYGDSKLQGEKHIQSILTNYFIIRTSWLYSEHGNNFVKTMLRLAQTMDEIQVVNDQVGSPTYAKDLASLILNIIIKNNKRYGIYHFCNSGAISWYEFTSEIFKLKNRRTKVNPVPSSSYKTLAIRPSYSVLNTHKSENNFNIKVKPFLTSLRSCLKHL